MTISEVFLSMSTPRPTGLAVFGSVRCNDTILGKTRLKCAAKYITTFSNDYLITSLCVCIQPFMKYVHFYVNNRRQVIILTRRVLLWALTWNQGFRCKECSVFHTRCLQHDCIFDWCLPRLKSNIAVSFATLYKS